MSPHCGDRGHAGGCGPRSRARGCVRGSVHVEQEVPVGKDLAGRTLANDAVLFGEHEAAVGEHLERVEVVSGRRAMICRLRLSSTMSSISHCWVRGSSAAVRLVEEHHLRVHRQHREAWASCMVMRVNNTRFGPSCWCRPMFNGPKAISSRTTGRRLGIGALEDKTGRPRNPWLNCSSSRLSSLTSAPKAAIRAAMGKTRAVEHLQQRRLAAAVGTRSNLHLLAR